MITAIWAFLMDACIGDPQSRWHPVALMGRLIAWLEKVFYRREDSPGRQFLSGSILVILVLLISYELAAGLIYLSYRLPVSWGSEVLSALMLAFMISPRSLAQAGRRIYDCLVHGDLAGARRATGCIVGRDTEQLDDAELARAAVESVAENTSDGTIAPLFWFAIGGVPLAVLYRAANTMDSMLGYKNERYLYFGRPAARLDDVLNYIPARLTGMLFVMSAFLLGYDGHNALRVMRRDAAKHPSPNGGYAEAAMAGALQIRLGGENSYFGQKTFRAYMGDVLTAIVPQHILAANRMMYTAVMLFLTLAVLLFQWCGFSSFSLDWLFV